MQVYNDELSHHGVMGMRWEKKRSAHKNNKKTVQNGAKFVTAVMAGIGAQHMTSRYLSNNTTMNGAANLVASIIVGSLASRSTASLLNY